MNINITLIVQAVNFFIAYHIMRTFLLKPAVQVIQDEQAQQTKLNTVIRQQEQSITTKEGERQKYWQTCRDYFKDNKPFIDQAILFIKEIPEVSVPVVSDDLVDKLVEETQYALIQKIGHTYE